jgi:uncharacterized protein (DUF433 family)
MHIQIIVSPFMRAQDPPILVCSKEFAADLEKQLKPASNVLDIAERIAMKQIADLIAKGAKRTEPVKPSDPDPDNDVARASGLERRPAVLGGAWCFIGTRIPVANLMRAQRDGMPRERMLKEWPGLDATQLDAALDFARTRGIGTCDEDCEGCPWCCADCEAATGGQCKQHYQPECTCYEPVFGHAMGCYFYGRKPPTTSEVE